MKKLFTIVVLTILTQANILSQERPHDAYFYEEQTYFINLLPTSYGLVLTDNYASNIYLLKDSKLNILFSAPGCGRYMKLTPDKNGILFKHINNKGQQAPALLNLADKKVEYLAEFTSLCSQPVADNQQNVGYTLPESFVLKNNSEIKSFSIPGYVNYPALSGNGKFLVINNDDDQLFLIDLQSGISKQITDNNTGYIYPEFSPDNMYLSYNSMDGELYLYDFLNNSSIHMGKGGHVRWITENRFLFTSYDDNGNSAISHIEIFSNGNFTKHILNLPEGASFGASLNNELYFTKPGTREIYKTNLSSAINNRPKSILIYKSEQKLPVSYQALQTLSKAIVKVPGTVPYVHQVYDTPTWHSGWGSCAPTTSAMAFAYYNRLPPWPVNVDHGQSWDPHVNNYGSYVADRYRFNEIYYSETADAYGTTAYGGYGYMWTGSYSPNSRMRQYIENHYMTSNQLWTTSCTFNNTIAEIDAGYVHPICNYLTTSGHLILTTGYIVGQHTLIFNDPYGDKNTAGYPSYDGYDAYYDWPGYNNGYQNLDATGTHGGVAWTVKSQTSQPLYNDTIIDNVDYNQGFFMSNVTNGSHMRYFHDFNAGYNGHTWWTYTMLGISDICYVTWGPNLPQAGNYKVEVYIPSNGADANGARYKIHYNGGDTLILLNQANYSDEWVELGTFPFHAGQGDYVYLGDSTGIDNEMIAFDAMRWSFVPNVSANFTSTNSTICSGETIQFTNTSQNADSCLWILTGSDVTVTNQLNPNATYPTQGTYPVTLIAYSQYGNDTISFPNYVTVNASPIAGFNCGNTNLQLPNAIALFTNTSQNATSCIWNFGDGSNSTDQNPYHIYSATGTYTVTLIVSNGLCPSDTLIMNDYITVLNASGLMESQNDKPSIIANNNLITLINGNQVLSDAKLSITDELGRTIYSKQFDFLPENYEFSVENITGIIFITLSSDNGELVCLKHVLY